MEKFFFPKNQLLRLLFSTPARRCKAKLILKTFLLSLHDGGYVEYVVCGSVCWPDRTEP